MAIRDAVGARLVALGSPWIWPDVPFDLFGVDRVPDNIPVTIAHGAFALGVGETVYTARQRANAFAETTFMVRFLARVVASAKLTSESAAHTLEIAARTAVMGTSASYPGACSFRLARARRTCPAPGEWWLHELAFSATHVVTL